MCSSIEKRRLMRLATFNSDVATYTVVATLNGSTDVLGLMVLDIMTTVAALVDFSLQNKDS